ncbi:MAG: MoxR family ATPase [Pirellulales bacterium]|nr:MoxR family ATPase [Pirellulales bacterium]HJN64589.1 MoxR family ATPase [Pirellulales bacterium]
MSQVVLGRTDAIRLCIVALLAGEHVLLEDVPGVGKTLFGKAIAKSVNGQFCRIQFTPDLLPGDITGTNVYRQASGEFEFIKGPVFANIVLADEINRTTPRTQSALLEAMSDGQVSSDAETHNLPQPFMVIATQNPFEFEGTYPLPESQLDRFLLRISLGYPNRDEELQVLDDHRAGEPVERLQPVLGCEQILAMQKHTRQVRITEPIRHYLLDLVQLTRESDALYVGASTRGALCLYRAAQALATVNGRDYVIPDDIKHLAVPVLAHRVITKGYMHSGHRKATESLLERLVDQIPVPA